MKLNADFSQRAVVHGADLPWLPSPIPGVERRMLDRVGDEVARATTIVRYAPNSQFSSHVHGGGEEFLVLEGVFQDEHGDYPIGTYVRNPPTSSHRPGSAQGCVILVKLWQFDSADRAALTLDTTQQSYVADLTRPGVGLMPLFADHRERVRLERWDAQTEIDLLALQGLEIFVIQGSFTESGAVFQRYSWLRLPSGARLSAKAGPVGCEMWVKQLC
jgi:anti-sigma factor ChrR (cupin superfamily)